MSLDTEGFPWGEGGSEKVTGSRPCVREGLDWESGAGAILAL